MMPIKENPIQRGMKMIKQITYAESKEFYWKWVYKTSAAATLMAGAVLLIAGIDLVIAGLGLGTINGWFSLFQNNWLVLIFKLHAGFSDVQANMLHVLNLLDVAILALVGVMCLGIYGLFRNISKVLSLITLALPFLGMILFITTGIAGRSSVMGAGLIISLVMLRNNVFSKIIAYVGILANTFLLAGDFSVGFLHSNLIATFFGIGYLLLIAWFFFMGSRLFQLGR